MRHVLCSVLMIAGVSACTATPGADTVAAEARVPAEPQPAPGFDDWGTGSGAFFYHRLSGTCEILTHAHGRNAAWGRWELPLAHVVDGGAEESEGAAVFVRFTCTDGSACIGQGALDVTPERVAEHRIPFETMDLARAYTVKISNLRTACGLTP